MKINKKVDGVWRPFNSIWAYVGTIGGIIAFISILTKSFFPVFIIGIIAFGIFKWMVWRS